MSKFDRIAGYADEKKELMNVCKIFKNHDDFFKKGLRLPRGILLAGKPGVGKTILAEAMIEEAGVHVERIDFDCAAPDKIGDYLDQKFKKAIENAPSIVFMDELDKFVGQTPEAFSEDYDMHATRQIIKAINDNVCDEIMILATINYKDMLCAALRRSGRFDRTINVPLPNYEDRKAIIEYYAKNKPFEKSVNFKTLARITGGFTGADLECVINDAGVNSVVNDREFITQADLDCAVNRLVFKSSVKEEPALKAEKDVIAVHEAGHLVAGLVLDEDSVGSATILPQGESGGHVKFCEFDQRLKSKNAYLNDVVIALAGRAAEKLRFPGVEYMGAANDIIKANDVVTDLLTIGCCYGLEYYVKPKMGVFPDMPLSEEKLHKIEIKQYEIIADCMQRAEKIIEANADLLDKFVEKLKRNYTLSREEILKTYKNVLKDRLSGKSRLHSKN